MKTRKGFTITELIVCLSILTIISVGISISSKDTQSAGSYHVDKALASSVASAVSRYRFETGNFPTSLSILTTKNSAGQGPWLNNSNLIDSHRQQLLYKYNSSERWFKVYSAGSNKADNSGSAATIGGDDVGVVITQ